MPDFLTDQEIRDTYALKKAIAALHETRDNYRNYLNGRIDLEENALCQVYIDAQLHYMKLTGKGQCDDE